MTKKEVLKLSDSAVDTTVKIQGTKFDRKVKISPSTIDKMKYLSACGYSNYKIAKMCNVSHTAVRYHLDPEYRYAVNHSGGTHAVGYLDLHNRANYKRKLVSSNAHVIYPMA